jgi:hypothetical protein
MHSWKCVFFAYLPVEQIRCLLLNQFLWLRRAHLHKQNAGAIFLSATIRIFACVRSNGICAASKPAFDQGQALELLNLGASSMIRSGSCGVRGA